MGRADSAVSEEAARSLVEFLRAAEGRYVAKFPGRIGALPYFRPAEYGGFKVKSLVGPNATAIEKHISDEEMVEMLTEAHTIEVVDRADTPPRVWGQPREDGA